MEKQEIFTNEFLKEIGFTLIEPNTKKTISYQTKKAISNSLRKIIEWDDEGYSCTYSGTKLEPNTCVKILNKGINLYAFDGYVYTQDDVRKILSLIW